MFLATILQDNFQEEIQLAYSSTDPGRQLATSCAGLEGKRFSFYGCRLLCAAWTVPDNGPNHV